MAINICMYVCMYVCMYACMYKDVNKSTSLLLQSNAVLEKEVICNTPLWQDSTLQIQTKTRMAGKKR